MRGLDQHYRIIRFLRSPVVDCSIWRPGEEVVSHKAVKLRPHELELLKPGCVRTLCLSAWDNADILPLLWGVLADGGKLISDQPITDDIRKRLRKECAFSLQEEGPFTVISKMAGKPAERPVLVRKAPPPGKSLALIRYGAYGDHLMVSAVIDFMKKDGWHITYLSNNKGQQIFKGDPRIDDIWVHEENILPPDDSLRNYWKAWEPHFDKIVNLTGIIEDNLLRTEGKPGFDDPYEKRQAECNVNYIDAHFERMGLPEVKGKNPSIWLSEKEVEWAKAEIAAIKKKTGKSRVVVYSLAGSSFHKVWPGYRDLFWLAQQNEDDFGFVTIGDKLETMLEVVRSNVACRAGCYSIRQSIALISQADAIVAPETGMIVAASAFDIPKVCMLSHASKENLTKYWVNDFSIAPPQKECPCYPCHQLHYTRNSCPKGTHEPAATLCMDRIQAVDVYYRLMEALGLGDHIKATAGTGS